LERGSPHLLIFFVAQYSKIIIPICNILKKGKELVRRKLQFPTQYFEKKRKRELVRRISPILVRRKL
jgi:hypothetical protein